MYTGGDKINSELEILHEATDNLVNQQFYRGTDRIHGRTQDVSLKIRKSGQIIAKFKSVFKENLDLFLNEKYLDFLMLFKRIKGLDDDAIISEIYEECHVKLEALRNTDIDIVVLYTIIVSSLLSKLRQIHFDATIEEIKKRVKNKALNKITDKTVQDELNQLYMRNNDNISILYNISYLDALADSYNFSTVARTLKIQKGIYMNKVVDIILKSQ